MMDDSIFDNYRQAGEIAARILREGAAGIRAGASYLEVVESIESRVTGAGAGLAFPLNLSLNEDAAHDTASTGDDRIFSQGDVVKLDLGVHVDGSDHGVVIDTAARGLKSACCRSSSFPGERRHRSSPRERTSDWCGDSR